MGDSTDNLGELLTVQEAASEANLTENAVRVALKRENLQSVRKFNRVLIRRSDFDAWRAQTRMGRPKKEASK